MVSKMFLWKSFQVVLIIAPFLLLQIIVVILPYVGAGEVAHFGAGYTFHLL